MIRRDFIKLVSIATGGLSVLRFAGPTTAVATPTQKLKRQWLTGSSRSGCAHLPQSHDLLPQ